MSQKPLSPVKAPSSSGNTSRPALKKRIHSSFQSYGRGIGNVWRRLGDVIATFFKRLWRGNVDEEKKVVLRKSLGRAMFRCSVHLLAMSVTATIAFFSLAGYFIGAELQGLTGGVYQALDMLCLQVTAKLQVSMFTF